jgi:hypothetical protein
MSGADNTRWKAPPTTRDAMDMSASTCQHCALIGVRHSAPGREGDQAGPQVSLLLADQELSRAIKEAQSQQIKVGAPEHAPLDQFEPQHLAFGLTIADLRRERRSDGGLIPAQATSKPLEFWKLAVSGLSREGSPNLRRGAQPASPQIHSLIRRPLSHRDGTRTAAPAALVDGQSGALLVGTRERRARAGDIRRLTSCLGGRIAGSTMLV